VAAKENISQMLQYAYSLYWSITNT